MMNFPRVHSLPVEVHWAGWRSNTLALQRAGWQISMMQDPAYMAMRMAINHPELKMKGISRHIDVEFHRMQIEREYLKSLWFDMEYMASEMVVRIMDGLSNLSKYSPINAEPQVSFGEWQDIEDVLPFRRIEGQEIIVEPETVPGLLERVLEMQSPKQKEIREKLRKEAKRRGQDIFEPATRGRAQIISLVA